MKNKILLLFLLCCSFPTLAQEEGEGDIVKIGEKAPNFSITIDGKPTQLSDLKGKVVLINFFATWCGPCMTELPVLQKKVFDKYKENNNFSLMILGRGHNEAEIEKFVKSKKYTMPFYPDFDKSIYNLYASKFIPRNYIIDKNGIVVYASRGYNPEEFEAMTNFLDKLIKE
jgi:peroxiredoxin